MENIIQSWLNGSRSYATGIKLYSFYGKNEAYKKILTFPETPFRKEQLIAAMEELLAPPPTAEPVTGIDTGDDDIVQELKAKAIPLFKERNSLHSKLKLFKTIAERGKAAHRILDLDDEIDEIYDTIRYYHEHRQLPEKLPFQPVTDAAKWEARYQVCGRYVRRYMAILDKEPENAKALELKNRYEAEQLWLAKKLNKWH